MKPRTPPPAPYCQALPWVVATTVSSAIAKDSKANWRITLRAAENMIADLNVVIVRVE